MKQFNKTKSKSYPGYFNASFCLYFLILILFTSTTAGADDQYPNWSFKGFGTIGLIRTDTDKLGFYRERSQEKSVEDAWKLHTDSRLGLQIDVDINDNLHSTIQWVGREHSGNFIEQNLDWAFFRWSPDRDIDIRIGRMGFDSFLLSEYRNVGFAYPWMRPPHEFYANVPVSHFDGADIKKSISLANGYLSLKAYAGYSSLFEEFASFELDGPLAGANIVYEFKNWKIKAGYTFIKLAKEQPFLEMDLMYLDEDEEVFPGITDKFAPLLSIKGSHFHFITIGTEYDNGTWLVHAEASYMNSEDNIFYHDISNAYLSIGRRFSNVTLYSLFGISESSQADIKMPAESPFFIDDPYVEELREYWLSIMNGNGADEKSVSIGLRWDFHPKVAFKVEWDHFWAVNGATGLLWSQNDFDIDPPDTVNVLSFGIDFIF